MKEKTVVFLGLCIMLVGMSACSEGRPEARLDMPTAETAAITLEPYTSQAFGFSGDLVGSLLSQLSQSLLDILLKLLALFLDLFLGGRLELFGYGFHFLRQVFVQLMFQLVCQFGLPDFL